MNNRRQETVHYTIQREFLGKITVAELVKRIIQSHVKIQPERAER